MDQEPNPGPLEGQQVLLTTEMSLQPLDHIYLSVCVVVHIHTKASMQKLEDSMEESVLSLHNMYPRDQTQINGLGTKCLYQ